MSKRLPFTFFFSGPKTLELIVCLFQVYLFSGLFSFLPAAVLSLELFERGLVLVEPIFLLIGNLIKFESFYFYVKNYFL